MKDRKIILVMLALLMMGGGAGLIAWMKANQRLGNPGVKTAPIAGSKNLEVLLPELVLNYTSQIVTQQELVVATLPKDTSYGQRMYTAPDGFIVLMNVVLMGSDRTSIHKPQFCVEGAGWRIDSNVSREELIRVNRPTTYDLPVMKLLTTKEIQENGQSRAYRGVYAYWFVAEDTYTADHNERMWWMARELLKTGMLQRWAYITCFSVCRPGEEEATFNRMKEFIAASVPEFQLTPRGPASLAATP